MQVKQQFQGYVMNKAQSTAGAQLHVFKYWDSAFFKNLLLCVSHQTLEGLRVINCICMFW